MLMGGVAGRLLAVALFAVVVAPPAAAAASPAAPTAIWVALVTAGGITALVRTGVRAALLAVGLSFARRLAVVFVVSDGFTVGKRRHLVGGRRGIVAVLGSSLGTIIAVLLGPIVVTATGAAAAAAAAAAAPPAPATLAGCAAAL